MCFDIDDMGLIGGLAKCPIEEPLRPCHHFLHSHLEAGLLSPELEAPSLTASAELEVRCCVGLASLSLSGTAAACPVLPSG